MIMDDKKGMCGDCREGAQGSDNNCGKCDHCLVGKHHSLARMLLCLAILFFVFWVGLAMGELKAYLREGRDGSYGITPMMYVNNGYKMMDPANQYDTTVPSPVPKK